jgi:hypothetical protein
MVRKVDELLLLQEQLQLSYVPRPMSPSGGMS